MLQEKLVSGDTSLHYRKCLCVVAYVCAVLGQIFAPWGNCINCEIVLPIVGWIMFVMLLHTLLEEEVEFCH